MTKNVPINRVDLTMYVNSSYVLKTVDPNRDKINPDKLANKINIVKEEGNFIDGLFDFFFACFELRGLLFYYRSRLTLEILWSFLPELFFVDWFSRLVILRGFCVNCC